MINEDNKNLGVGADDSKPEAVADKPTTPPQQTSNSDLLVTLTKEEYGLLKKIEKESKNMLPITKYAELETEYIATKNELSKLRVVADSTENAGNVFEVAKKLSSLKELSTKYGIGVDFETVSSLKQAELTVLEAFAKKYGISDFVVDASGNLNSQIQNIELLVQQSNLFRQSTAYKETKETVLSSTLAQKAFNK